VSHIVKCILEEVTNIPEIINEVLEDKDGNYIVTEDHSIADVVRFAVSLADVSEIQSLLDECGSVELWQRKLTVESNDLAEKIRKLHLFFASETFRSLEDIGQSLLYRQLDIMNSYQHTLQLRIEGLK